MISRGTRKLDLNIESKKSELVDDSPVQSQQPLVTKEQLRELFNDEINSIIATCPDISFFILNNGSNLGICAIITLQK